MPPARKARANGPSSPRADLGVPLTLIGEAVFARCLSAQKAERVAGVEGAQRLYGFGGRGSPRRRSMTSSRRFMRARLFHTRKGLRSWMRWRRESKWEINRGGVALMWRGGCIIRSAFLGKIKEAFDRNPKLTNLMLDPYFRDELERCQLGWRRTAMAALAVGFRAPAMTAALAYFDGYRCESLPANLLQAQRDYFGAAPVRTGGPAAGAILPHELDRARRHDVVVVV